MTFKIKLALRYLQRRKLRTTLTLLAIIFGTMIIVAFSSLLPALKEALTGSLSAVAEQVDLTVTNETRGAFGEETATIVAETPGVAVASPSLARPLVVPDSEVITADDGTTFSSFIVHGVDPEKAAELGKVSVGDGRLLQAGDENTVLISSNMAEKAHLSVGDQINVPAATGIVSLEIVGITTGRTPIGSEELFVPLMTAQTIFDQPGQINTIEAQFDPGSDAAVVRQAVLDRLGTGFHAGGIQAGSEFASALEAANYVFNMFGLIATAMGGFIIFITFRTIIVERRRDIGMLRAIGASRKTVLSMILVESLTMGVIGTGLGIAVGVLLAKGLHALLNPVMDSLMHINLGTLNLSPGVFILAAVLGLGITLVSSILPAMAATKLSPLEALRPSLAEVERRKAGRSAIVGGVLIVLSLLALLPRTTGFATLGMVLFMIGLALVGPALVYPVARIFGSLLTLVFAREGQIAEGNLTRQPGRAAVTASTITIGLALLVALGGLITSLIGGIGGWVDKTLGSDYLFMPQSLVLGGGNIGAGSQFVDEIRAVPGVDEVTTLRQTTAKVDNTDLQVIGIDPVTYPEIAGLIFSQGDESTVFDDLASGRNIIINGIFAAQNGLALGDDLTLKTPEGEEQYHVVGVGGDFLNYKIATGYISQANLARDFNVTADLLVMVNQSADANASQVGEALGEIGRNYPAFTFYTLQSFRDEMAVIFQAYNAIYIFLIILAVPSLIALINTLAINVLERTREIGTLRAVGATRRQVRRMITAESLLLTAMGAVFGIIAGLWLGYVLVGAMNLVGLVFPFSFSYISILMAVVVAIGFGIIGALIPARQAAQMDIVKALAYE
ncbi:MAG: FtsX-like permease family protein [Candidatus Promineifilaceae bacterium]